MSMNGAYFKLGYGSDFVGRAEGLSMTIFNLMT